MLRHGPQGEDVTIRNLSTVSAALIFDDESEDVHITAYDLDGHVVLAVADPPEDEAGLHELDDFAMMHPDSAEAYGRFLIAAADRARRAVRPEVADA